MKRIYYKIAKGIKVIALILALILQYTFQSGGNNYVDKQSHGNIRLCEKKLTAVAILPQASERELFAANELISYLFKITGERLPLINISNLIVPEGVIAVGQLSVNSGLIFKQELDSVADDGYIIKISRNKGAICGFRDLGTLYGVYELLKQVGVKFYAKECEVVPYKPDLLITNMEYSRKPFFGLRGILYLDELYHGYKPSTKLGFTPNDDVGFHGDLGLPGDRNPGHTASFLMPYQKYGKEHPEFFALQKDGQRYKPGNGPSGHLCLSNSEMRKISSERFLYLIREQKNRSFFVVSQGDGLSEWWCQCDSCKVLDADAGNHMTDRLLNYVNYMAGVVASKYPDKKVLTPAYTKATSRPPEKTLPAPNVRIMYCLYPPSANCQSHGLECPKNKQALEELKGWLSKCPDQICIFDYPRGYRVWYEPFGSFYATVNKVKTYASLGVKGVYHCMVPTNFRDLFMFVQGRLLWDPKADVEALVDEFMSEYYGAAAPAVRDYFNLMHHEIDSRQIHQMCEKSNPELVTALFADNALEIFSRAQVAVMNDSIRLRRVENEKFCVLWCDIFQRNTKKGNLSTSLDEHILRFKEMVRIARDMEVMKLGGGNGENGFKAWISSVAPISLQSEPWYYDPAIDALMAYPENLFKQW